MYQTDPRRQALQTALTYEATRGYYVEHDGGYSATIAREKRHNHMLHIALCIFTLGLWLPVWIALMVFGGHRERWVISADPWCTLTRTWALR